MNLARKLYDYHVHDWDLRKLPNEVDWINPYVHKEVRAVTKNFYQKYYNDTNKRVYLVGINPGRFGAGVTGIPFTDPLRLEKDCQIANSFTSRQEMSSAFIYDMISLYGGTEKFYRQFVISSVCPLGFLLGNKNYNYYDDKELQSAVIPLIESHLKRLEYLNANKAVIVSIGQGKNYQFLKNINEKLNLFDKVLKLPHPRWVMQYRLKKKDFYLDEYVKLLTQYES